MSSHLCMRSMRTSMRRYVRKGGGLERGALVCARGVSTYHKDGQAMTLDQRFEMASEHYSDFTLQYPPRREYFKELFRSHPQEAFAPAERLLLEKQWPQGHQPSEGFRKRQLLYVHVPFCEHKCSYCNFAVDTRKNKELHQGYITRIVNGLRHLDECLSARGDGIDMHGIDIGGGTPTAIEASELERLLGALRPIRDRCSHPLPLSIETTPAIATAHPERIRVLKDGGVDRVSMGLQSTDDAVLEELKRGREVGIANEAVAALQREGFERISVDIIFGLPGQSMEHWKEDLRRVVELGVDVVTAYDCLYRGKGRSMTRAAPEVPSQESYAEMYDYCYDFLTRNGFHARYGSVNFSRRPEETGTSAYFEGRLRHGFQYIGLGNYASSLCQEQWWFAPYHVDQWMSDVDSRVALLREGASPEERLSAHFPVGDCYSLLMEERAAKHVLLSLSFGVIDARTFMDAFAVSLESVFGETLKYACEEGLLVKSLSKEGHVQYSMPPGSFRWVNQLRSLFYTDRAMGWLRAIKKDGSRMYAHKRTAKRPFGSRSVRRYHRKA